MKKARQRDAVKSFIRRCRAGNFITARTWHCKAVASPSEILIRAQSSTFVRAAHFTALTSGR